MMKKVLVLLVVVGVFAAGALAQAKTQALIRKDGRRHVGRITRTANGYEVRMKVGVIVVPAHEVDRIEDATTPIEEFAGRLAKVTKSSPKSAPAHFKLAQWAFKNGLLSEAKDTLQIALELDKDYFRAKLLLKQIDAKLKRTDPSKLKEKYREKRALLEKNDVKGYVALGKWAMENKLLKEARAALKTALNIDPNYAPALKLLKEVDKAIEGVTLGDEYLLSLEDIYKVRLEEFRLTGDPVRVQYRKRVLQRFVAAMSGRDDFSNDARFGEKFMGYSTLKRLQYILDPERDIDQAALQTLKKDILVKSDPAFMKEFRTRVWPVVRQACATTACHGAPKGKGKFKLFNSPARNVKIPYTNYVILAGTVGKKGRRVLDRDTPDESLLLEYLIPKSLAKSQHPGKKIRHAIKNREQRAYKLVRDWIASLRSPGYPDYRLDYKPPLGMKLHLSGGGGALVPRRGGTLRPRPDGALKPRPDDALQPRRDEKGGGRRRN